MAGLKVQAVAMLIAAIWGSRHLDRFYPLTFSWEYILIPAALGGVVHSYSVALRFLMRTQPKKVGSAKSTENTSENMSKRLDQSKKQEQDHHGP